MKISSLIVGLLLCCVVSQVEAGPFGRFGRNSCSSGNCSSSYNNQVVGGGCSSGNCAVPSLVATQHQVMQEQPVQEFAAVKHVEITNASVKWDVNTDRPLKKKNPLVEAFYQRKEVMSEISIAQSLAKSFR